MLRGIYSHELPVALANSVKSPFTQRMPPSQPLASSSALVRLVKMPTASSQTAWRLNAWVERERTSITMAADIERSHHEQAQALSNLSKVLETAGMRDVHVSCQRRGC
jgi:hypothetical protein